MILEDHDAVENLSSIEGATVPIITFDFEGVNIDLLFASLPVDSVPEDFDVNEDDVVQIFTARYGLANAPSKIV